MKKEEAIEKLAILLYGWLHSTGANWDKEIEVVRVSYRKRASETIAFFVNELGYRLVPGLKVLGDKEDIAGVRQ